MSKKPVYLTSDDIEWRITQLETGEISDAGEVVKDYDSPNDFHGMFPELLCKHGIRRGLCYPCAPLPTKDPNRILLRSVSMDEYTNIEKMTTTELLEWLKKQELYGLNRLLAKRLADHYSAYYRIRNEANMMRIRLQEKYNDVMVAED